MFYLLYLCTLICFKEKEFTKTVCWLVKIKSLYLKSLFSNIETEVYIEFLGLGELKNEKEAGLACSMPRYTVLGLYP